MNTMTGHKKARNIAPAWDEEMIPFRNIGSLKRQVARGERAFWERRGMKHPTDDFTRRQSPSNEPRGRNQ